MIAAAIQAAAEYAAPAGGKLGIDLSGLQQIAAWASEHRVLLLAALVLFVVVALAGSTRRI